MNRYPAWLNLLVLSVFLLGTILALPNIYGSSPAVQMVNADNSVFTEQQLENVVDVLENMKIIPEALYIDDGRGVIRFNNIDDQLKAGERLRNRLSSSSSVALTLAPKLPEWIRLLGLKPMSLGLDLRGGVYFLLEVDMDTAVQTRLTLYEQSFSDLLREESIVSRVDVSGNEIIVRVRNLDDLEIAEDLIRDADIDLLIIDNQANRTLRISMTETQIRARQDFAIEQNITTLRNRVNQLGVAEPLVQRQGLDRIVVQLPGVQDPNRLDDILTATATLEFRLVDIGTNSPGSKRYNGRGGASSQILRREIVASGDQIIDAESGFSQGQPAVFITLDSVGGESMLKTTRQNLKNPCQQYLLKHDEFLVILMIKPKLVLLKLKRLLIRQPSMGSLKIVFKLQG